MHARANILPCCLAAALLASMLAVPAIDAQQPRRATQRTAAPSAAAAWASAEVARVLDRLQDDQRYEPAAAELDRLFDTLIAHAPASEAGAFLEVAEARRLVTQLAEADAAHRAELLTFLRERPRLRRALVFLVRPDVQDVSNVYGVLDELRRERGDDLEPFANLTAAICAALHRPIVTRINENTARSPGPLAVFDYYVRNERRMLFGIREMPPELLVYVVDVAASIEELEWALARYAGDRRIGDRFFDINYDVPHFRQGRPKRVNQHGWNMPNILRHGGVCADQAYFAVTAGKAIGVPAVYTWGRDGTVAHAWVGYLEQQGRNVRWNFDSGRYEPYQGVRGNARDPQSRTLVPDGHLSLLGDLVRAPEPERRHAAALVDAAERLARHRRSPISADTPPAWAGEQPVREPTLDARLGLIEAGLRRSPAYLPGWRAIMDLARGGQLDHERKVEWSGVLMRLCGSDHPDFVLDVLTPMIRSEPDAERQHELWEACIPLFRTRRDLAAAVRMDQGELWLKRDDRHRAWQAYHGVVTGFANDGPWAIEAAEILERMLTDAGRPQAEIVGVWERLHNATRSPNIQPGSPFFNQSNWYRSGEKYAAWLERVGRAGDARRIHRRMGR